MNAPEKKCDKVNASGATCSGRSEIPEEMGGRRPDILEETDCEISTSEGKGKSMENISGWLIHTLCEISPSLLESEAELPDCDLEKVFTAGKAKEYGMSPRTHSNWKMVVAASGLAAACSAAVTGIVVFACMKHSASFN